MLISNFPQIKWDKVWRFEYEIQAKFYFGNNQQINGYGSFSSYCRANQEWRWHNRLFTIVKSNIIVCQNWPETYEYSMTFYSVFVNLRKKCALDCCTITYLNEISQFPDSLVDSRVF